MGLMILELERGMIMRLCRITLMLTVLGAFAAAAQAGTAQSELTLYKDPVYEFNSPRHHGLCEGLFYLKEGRDTPDLRDDFQYYHCEGKHTLTLDGPKNKMVTLFGGFKYGQEGGYLVLRKTDAGKVWITDLMDFPSGQWVKVPPQEWMGVEYGAYEVFYHAAPLFDQNISSLKWGQRRQGDKP